MPNRIIKESICVSDTINELSWFEECLFYRLIVNCDDFGRFDARPAIIKGKLFPLKERLALRDIQSALHKLAVVGCVSLYECDGKPYLQLPTWIKHQSPRAKNSKFPAPETHLQANACNCNQMHANVPDNENDKRYSSNDKRYSKNDYKPGAEKSASVLVASLILNDKTFHSVYQDEVDRYQELYPAVDVMQELRNMAGWLESNPTKRKTKRGINSFINSWLARNQDKGGAKKDKPQTVTSGVQHENLAELEEMAIKRLQGGGA